MSRPKTGPYAHYIPTEFCNCCQCRRKTKRSELSEVEIGNGRMRRMCPKCKDKYKMTRKLTTPNIGGLINRGLGYGSEK